MSANASQVIRHSRYSVFVIRYSLFVIRYSLFIIQVCNFNAIILHCAHSDARINIALNYACAYPICFNQPQWTDSLCDSNTVQANHNTSCIEEYLWVYVLHGWPTIPNYEWKAGRVHNKNCAQVCKTNFLVGNVKMFLTSPIFGNFQILAVINFRLRQLAAHRN